MDVHARHVLCFVLGVGGFVRVSPICGWVALYVLVPFVSEVHEYFLLKTYVLKNFISF